MKIPYGIHDYKTIKTEDYLFIDKTKFIEEIEKVGKYNVFLRPRRFGKSLFTSMLYYYHDINSESLFNELFSDTYIGKHKTMESNNYYILKFDFSGINTEKELVRTSFFREVKYSVDACIEYYNINVSIEDDIKDANEYLKSFLQKVRVKTDKQIYLIIDEYDHFANNVLTSDLELFNEITGKDGFVRAFYEVFKTYAGTVIGRMFITGVTPITLDSLTSGFNMAINLSKEELLNEMMGFTEEEVINILDRCNINKQHLTTLKENYNGYLFSQDSNIRLYNSNMILYYVRPFTLKNKPPNNLIDPNIVSDYTKITNMFDLYKNTDDKKEIIHNILNNIPMSAIIVDKFNMKLEFNRDNFLSILYYLGLVTIKDSYGTEISLKTPNYIIKSIYFEYYYYYLNRELEINLDASHIRASMKELSQNNNIKPFVNLIEKFLKEIDNRDFIRFDEKYIKLLMMTYVNLSGLYMIKSEYPVGKYYIDLALLPNRIYELNNYFIFELKYISNSNYSDKLLNEKKLEAIEQINKYADNEEIKNIQNLRMYVFIFVHDECKVVEEI